MYSSLKTSSIVQGFPKFRSNLVGNSAFIPGGFEPIATVTAAGGESSLTFSSIPSTYSSLQIRFLATGSANWTNLKLRLNNVSTQSYTYHNLSGDGSSVVSSGAGTTGGTEIVIGYSAYMFPSYPKVGIIDLHDYSSSSAYKNVRTFSGINSNGNTASEVLLLSNLFTSTSPITSLNFFTSGGTFAAGSTFALYGVKSA